MAFVMLVFITIAAMRPFTVAETYAAERTAYRVTLIDGGTAIVYESTARNVGVFLEEQGIELHPLDNVSPRDSRRIEDRLTINIERAFYITLLIDRDAEQIKVAPGTTSGQVLSSRQASMDTALMFGGDTQRELAEGDVLEFATWRSREYVSVELIPYHTKYITTQNLLLGEEQISQAGVSGERRIETKVTYIGGIEYSREVLRESLLEPIPRIVEHGTGLAVVEWSLGALADTNCPTFEYVRRVTMNATAYTAGFSCTGRHPNHPLSGITASGRRVEHGIVAVDPSIIPLGTRLYVEGYGFALAADTGGAIRGYKIALFMYDLADARQFGRRDVTVFILDYRE
jgi:3D (Asp-Asp-Asp) domain-containing protein